MPQPIREEDLNTITKKVYALYAKHGFDGISMDKVSAQTNISKATLYRYFTSKEEIVLGMSDYLISHLDSVRFTDLNGISDVISSIQAFYIKSLLVATLSGTTFLTDLKRKFPDSYDSIYDAMANMWNRFASFYREAVDMGCLRDLSFPLIEAQISNMLFTVINIDYLEKNGLSLSDAIRECYRMFLIQVLDEDYLSYAKQEETYGFADGLADLLRNDFFIDSLRR